MLSAISEGKVYTAGFIPEAKSRTYLCPDLQCGRSVYHVDAHLRAGQERVTEHFRHPQEASHPIRKRSAMQGQALEFLLERLQCQPSLEVSTDRSFRTARGEMATDLHVREHLSGGKYIDTVVQVEDNEFNFNEHLALLSSLSAQGAYLMTVLCAQGNQSSSGYYYCTERRPGGIEVKKLRKNEKSLYNIVGANTYYEPDGRRLLLVRFSDYTETLRSPVRNHRGEIVKDIGTVTEFALKKIPYERRVITGPFHLERTDLPEGRLVAVPRSPIEERLQAEIQGYEEEERIAIMLDSLSKGERKILTGKYRQAMEGYACD